MTVYLVYDTKGNGRIVAIYDRPEPARELTERFPAYYELHPVELNRISPAALVWCDSDEQRAFLRDLIEAEET